MARRCGFRFILALGLVAFGLPAGAGIGEKQAFLWGPASPTKARVLYTFTGAVNVNGQLATVVFCTSTVREGGSAVLMGVEFYSQNGTALNDVTQLANNIAVGPGDTVSVATQVVNAFPPSLALPSPPNVYRGSGRVVANSKDLVCTAQVVDSANLPPTTWVSLPMFAGTKQGGN